MNIPKNKISASASHLFQTLESQLNETLYFYGSVARNDYVSGKSDIDVAIFTDNEHSVISQLQGILHISKKEINKVVYKLNDYVMYGYKVQIKKPNTENIEIAIYNNHYKDILIEEFNKPIVAGSFLIHFLLQVLKLFYYTIPVLPQQVYIWAKRIVLNDMMGKKASVFYSIHSN